MDRERYSMRVSRIAKLKKRADERTRTADPTSLRVIIQALQGFAWACKSRISKGISLLRLAPLLHRIAFPVVSEWYQRRPAVRTHPRGRHGSPRQRIAEFESVALGP